MTEFKNFNLDVTLTAMLEKLQFNTPTPVQSQAIPLVLDGCDLLASAQTGTGKTLAYLLPMMTKLLADPEHSALILTPTRELAVQVRDTVRQMIPQSSRLRSALLIGGEPMMKQFSQLRARPQLIVGTPGRINDHLQRRTLNLTNTKFLVLDESDRMLDMGFEDELEAIVAMLPTERQTLMFSATLPNNIVRLARKYLKDPKSISIGETSRPVEKIKQEVVNTSHAEKFPRLLKELDEREGSIIVFVKMKRTAAELAERLQDNFHEADAIHGDLRQRERDRVMKAFRSGKSRIMVATDIAARGLDIPQIKHVINYELPQCTDDYVHRIGRTARAGAEGNALCLVSPDDRRQWDMINRDLNPGAPRTSGGNQDGPRKPSRNFKGRRFDNGPRGGQGGPGGSPRFDRGSDRGGAGGGGGGASFWQRKRQNGKKPGTRPAASHV